MFLLQCYCCCENGFGVEKMWNSLDNFACNSILPSILDVKAGHLWDFHDLCIGDVNLKSSAYVISSVVVLSSYCGFSCLTCFRNWVCFIK